RGKTLHSWALRLRVPPCLRGASARVCFVVRSLLVHTSQSRHRPPVPLFMGLGRLRLVSFLSRVLLGHVRRVSRALLLGHGLARRWLCRRSLCCFRQRRSGARRSPACSPRG